MSTNEGVLSTPLLKGLTEAMYTGHPRTVHCTHIQEKYWFYPQILEYIQNKISYLVRTAVGQHISKYTLLKSLQAATFWLVISIYTISTGQRTEQHLIKLSFFFLVFFFFFLEISRKARFKIIKCTTIYKLWVVRSNKIKIYPKIMLQNSLRHAWRLCTHIHTKNTTKKVPSVTHLLRQGNKKAKEKIKDKRIKHK